MKQFHYENCNMIQPIQRSKVDDFIKKHCDDQNILRIIVFGSSVSDTCHIGSDIDIYLELLEDKPIKRYIYDYLVDIWNNYNIDDNLRKEIQKKGVLVYEQRNLS